MRQFFLVLCLALLAFTQAFFVAQSNEGSTTMLGVERWDEWVDLLRDQFLSAVQEPETEWMEEQYTWAFYWIRTALVFVVMMVILIAVVVSNYEVVAHSIDQQQYSQMCEIIIEQETFMIWNTKKNNQDKQLAFA
jgi:hypothetical protein